MEFAAGLGAHCCSEWGPLYLKVLSSDPEVPGQGTGARQHASVMGHMRGGAWETGLQHTGLKMAVRQQCAHLGCPKRPHLCHLNHIGELREAGDGDDIMVCPALGPGRRKPTLRGEAVGKRDGRPSTQNKGGGDTPWGAPELTDRGQAWLGC